MHLAQGFALRIEALRCAADNGGEIEAEAIDTGMGDEVAERFDDEMAHLWVIAGERIAGAGIVDQRAGIVGCVTVIGEVVETAQRQRRTEAIALARMVEDEIEDHADACIMQFGDRVAQFGDAAGAEPRIERHKADGVVTPAIGKVQRRQMPLVDPGGDRHQFHGADADLLEMGDDGRVGKGCDRAANGFRHVGVQHGEGLDGHFVDQAGAGEAGCFLGNDRGL